MSRCPLSHINPDLKGDSCGKSRRFNRSAHAKARKLIPDARARTQRARGPGKRHARRTPHTHRHPPGSRTSGARAGKNLRTKHRQRVAHRGERRGAGRFARASSNASLARARSAYTLIWRSGGRSRSAHRSTSASMSTSSGVTPPPGLRQGWRPSSGHTTP